VQNLPASLLKLFSAPQLSVTRPLSNLRERAFQITRHIGHLAHELDKSSRYCDWCLSARLVHESHPAVPSELTASELTKIGSFVQKRVFLMILTARHPGESAIRFCERDQRNKSLAGDRLQSSGAEIAFHEIARYDGQRQANVP
jgi:hypothetical protein